ncbi:hypothetical protein HOY80DRAFT_36625 [Tuber brumale]|nr:hypothetical protein HOY80DRAFT_36625 [Tuber brumale]
MSKPSPNDLPTILSNLALSSIPSSIPAKPNPPRSRRRKPKTLDSWEDASISSSSSSEDESNRPSPPPPTPTTPFTQTHTRNSSSVSSIASPRESISTPAAGSTTAGERGGGGERPVTTDAVARRMISASLGVRARSTKEQREYDAAVKAAERKRREGEKERSKLEEEERERVRRGIWED